MGFGEGLADVAGHFHVGRGRGPQAHADVLLADVHHLIRIRIGPTEAFHQGTLAGACNAGDDAEHAQGQIDGNALEVVQGGVFEVEEIPGRAGNDVVRHGRPDRPSRVLLERHGGTEHRAGGRAGAEKRVVRALEDDAAAVDARTGAQIYDVVGNPDHLRVVLHEEDGVAGVAQALDRALHPLDVAVGPVQAQVPEADLLQCGKPGADGRFQVHRERIGQVPDPGIEPGNGHRTGLSDVFPFDLAGQHLRIQPRAAAIGAGAHHEHRIEHRGVQEPFLGIDDGPVHPGDDALVFRRFGPVGRRVFEPDLRAVQEEVQLLRRIILDLLVQVEQAAVGIPDPAPAALAEGDVMDRILESE